MQGTSNQKSRSRVEATPPPQLNTQPTISAKRQLQLSHWAAVWEATPVNADVPARNTRARKKAQAKEAAPPTVNTQSSNRTSRLQRPPMKSSTTRPGQAAAVEKRHNAKQLQKFTQRVTKPENKVHQAMLVMYAATGKLPNHRALV